MKRKGWKEKNQHLEDGPKYLRQVPPRKKTEAEGQNTTNTVV